MLIKLLEVVPREQFLVVLASLGKVEWPDALEIEAIVIQGDQEHGDYFLLALADELNHSTRLSAAA